MKTNIVLVELLLAPGGDHVRFAYVLWHRGKKLGYFSESQPYKELWHHRVPSLRWRSSTGLKTLSYGGQG